MSMGTLRTSTLCTVLGLCSIAMPALAGSLVPPPGYYAEVQHDAKATEACRQPPPAYTGTLDFPSKYEGSGTSRDTFNEESDQRYKALTQPISDMEKGATRLVDRYMHDGSARTLQCALTWYGAWAAARALLGQAAGHTGRSERKWALASLSGAWLRLKFSRSQPLVAHTKEAANIESWLGTIASQVTQEWNENDTRDKINNHYYWAAWSVMATSVITDRRDLFDWSTRMYAIFSAQVDTDGFLPNELKRQTRAAGYQIYAVTPAAMIAAFGKANHVDLAGKDNNALQRAADRAVLAYDNPAAFEVRTGSAQVVEDTKSRRSAMAWLEPYCWTVECPGSITSIMSTLRPMQNTRLGGDMTAVFDLARKNP